MHLQELGWNAYFEQQLIGEDDPAWQPARVIAEQRERFTLNGANGEYLAEVSGRLRHQAVSRADFPAVGDWVLALAGEHGGRGVIQRVLTRMTCLSRKVPGRESEEQVLAANVDIVFIAASLNLDLNARRIERALALVHESGALPVVLLTKSDLCADADAARKSIESVARGVDVLSVSALEARGIADVRAYLGAGQTAVLLGSSGVGKSTLINALCGRERMATGSIRADDDRGRHTTTHRQLFALPGGGLIIDTPGLREIQLWAGTGALDAAFDDISALSSRCRFSDCRHESEPGCAILAALEDGTLEEARLASYRKLQGELAYLHRRENKAAQAAEKKRWKAINIQAREHIRKKRF